MRQQKSKSVPNTPKKISPSVPPTTTSNVYASQSPSFVSTIVQGFGFGAGSSVARNMVDRAFQPTEVAPTTTPTTTPTAKQDCQFLWESYTSCLNTNVDSCKIYYEDFAKCMKKEASV